MLTAVDEAIQLRSWTSSDMILVVVVVLVLVVGLESLISCCGTMSWCRETLHVGLPSLML